MRLSLHHSCLLRAPVCLSAPSLWKGRRRGSMGVWADTRCEGKRRAEDGKEEGGVCVLSCHMERRCSLLLFLASLSRLCLPHLPLPTEARDSSPHLLAKCLWRKKAGHMYVSCSYICHNSIIYALSLLPRLPTSEHMCLPCSCMVTTYCGG